MLKGVDADVFLRDYWQKKPLLLRGGLPDFSGFMTPEHVIALCEYEETPSRFFSAQDGMVPGPFTLDPSALPEGAWTVLVQSIETVDDAAWSLLDAFDFLPRARLDDVMVSYATPGGGVGPHFDLYDVFLVQGTGERRWRYAAGPVDASLDEQASGPFAFDADFDEVLGPGDVLYLPPRVPHDGAAVTACTTYSVGVAAPKYSDIVSEFFAYLSGEPDASGIDLRGVFSDENAAPATQRGRVPDGLVQDTLARLSRLRIDEQMVRTFLGRLLTGPKPHSAELFTPAEETVDLDAACRRGAALRVDSATRMLHDGAGTLFVNGDAVDVRDAARLCTLADERTMILDARLTGEERMHIAQWLGDGFVVLLDPEQ